MEDPHYRLTAALIGICFDTLYVKKGFKKTAIRTREAAACCSMATALSSSTNLI
ncbi:MAG: hypothetical protein MSD82_03785 [Prevotella sp.]|nr:hypothetical protein [Prevotella sp.]